MRRQLQLFLQRISKKACPLLINRGHTLLICRAIEQGGVTFGDEKVTDIRAAYTKEDLAGDGKLLRRGKKNFMKIVVK